MRTIVGFSFSCESAHLEPRFDKLAYLYCLLGCQNSLVEPDEIRLQQMEQLSW